MPRYISEEMRDARCEYECEFECDYRERICGGCIRAREGAGGKDESCVCAPGTTCECHAGPLCDVHARCKAENDASNARNEELCEEQDKRDDLWRQEHALNEVFYEMKNLRIRRWQLESVGLDADTILIRELISRQIEAKSDRELITQIRILFSYFQMVPTLLLKPSPEIRALVQRRIDVLRSNPKNAHFLPLMLAITES